MSRAIQILAALGFLAVLLTLLGWDYADAINTDADVKLARARAIDEQRESKFLLTHPIPYNAIVCQAGPGEPPRCHYYTERK